MTDRGQGQQPDMNDVLAVADRLAVEMSALTTEYREAKRISDEKRERMRRRTTVIQVVIVVLAVVVLAIAVLGWKVNDNVNRVRAVTSQAVISCEASNESRAVLRSFEEYMLTKVQADEATVEEFTAALLPRDCNKLPR